MKRKCYQQASLTLEAALVLPIFLYFIIAFLYFINIFTIQEQIQAAITTMGLNLSKSAYVLQDFPSMEDALDMDLSIFGQEYETELSGLVKGTINHNGLQRYASKYLKDELANDNCIRGGFAGLDFSASELYDDKQTITIVVSYRIKLPIHYIVIPDMQQRQRIHLRCWTGYQLEAIYQGEQETSERKESVFVTATGSVYHKSENCSHIKLSISSVNGIPAGLRNENGAKYYPCESCCSSNADPYAIYYITRNGTRYHSKRDCSRIKRSVKKISMSEVGSRTPCKRCYQ